MNNVKLDYLLGIVKEFPSETIKKEINQLLEIRIIEQELYYEYLKEYKNKAD